MMGWSIRADALNAMIVALWSDLQRHGIEYPGDTVLLDAAMLTGMYTLEAWRVRRGRYRDILNRHHWQRGVHRGEQEGYVTIGTEPSKPTRDAGRRSVVWHYALRKVGDQ